MCAVAAEEGGLAKTTVTDILHRAGISKKTFYRYFENKDACVRAAYDTYSARLAGELAAAWSGAESPVEGARAALTALLDFGAKAPAQLRFLLLDARSAGPAVVAEQRRAAERLAEALREARAEQPEAKAVGAPAIEEMIVAGIGWRIGRALLGAEPLADLRPELVEFALIPLVGDAGARG